MQEGALIIVINVDFSEMDIVPPKVWGSRDHITDDSAGIGVQINVDQVGDSPDNQKYKNNDQQRDLYCLLFLHPVDLNGTWSLVCRLIQKPKRNQNLCRKQYFVSTAFPHSEIIRP